MVREWGTSCAPVVEPYTKGILNYSANDSGGSGGTVQPSCCIFW